MKANTNIEANYPLSFRQEEAQVLGQHIRHRHNVSLIGMKRIGISNFLRFFLSHSKIKSHHISEKQSHLFIPVDLNDLVEREIFPFWTLTFKRVVDAIDRSDLPLELKKRSETLFMHSIQSQDLFLLIDGLRQLMVALVEQEILPTIFFLRFDRIANAINLQFFDNLSGLRDATTQKLSYIFTSYRSLEELVPEVFTKASLAVFSVPIYIQPAKPEDMALLFNSYKNRYELGLNKNLEKALFAAVDGNFQYLQLALIILNEKRKDRLQSAEELFNLLVKDERITLQSEELWESLTKEEQTTLSKLLTKEKILNRERAKAAYLWNTGMISSKNNELFSPLFSHYLKQLKVNKPALNSQVHFTKKENTLFSWLQENIDQICEREDIIDKVWPESAEFGVSDWSIDRLVARVRTKLKEQKEKYEIVTIRTRGYKLVEKS